MFPYVMYNRINKGYGSKLLYALLIYMESQHIIF